MRARAMEMPPSMRATVRPATRPRAEADDGRFSSSIEEAVQRLLAVSPPPAPPRAQPALALHVVEDEAHASDADAKGTPSGASARSVSGVFAAAVRSAFDAGTIAHALVAHPLGTKASALQPESAKSLAAAATTTSPEAAISPAPASTPEPAPRAEPASRPQPAHDHDHTAARSRVTRMLGGHDPSARDESAPAATTSPTHHVESPARSHEPLPSAPATVVAAVPAPPIAPMLDRVASRIRLAPSLPTDVAPDETEPAPQQVHFHELTTDHARVELSHPSLGRLDVEVHGDGAHLDVTLLTRSVGASIALRATEEGLRSELRARSTELRNYRVRTQAQASSQGPEDEEESA